MRVGNFIVCNLTFLVATLIVCCFSGCDSTASAQDAPTASTRHPDTLILVIGAAGAEEYASEFEIWATAWKQLATDNQWQTVVIQHTDDAKLSPHQQLKDALGVEATTANRLWLVLLGHGTYTNGISKFNLEGPDVSAVEMGQWLKAIDNEVIFINCSSASAAFLPDLSGPNRIVITATRSGTEINYSRFGKFLSASLRDLATDIDHDGNVSLLEAFLAASALTDRFYTDEARLASEHALIDDNQDRIGTTADFYHGINPSKRAKDGQPIDGSIASRIVLYSSPTTTTLSTEMADQRDQLEDAIGKLRLQKNTMAEATYYQQLETLLIKIAQLYENAESSLRH